MVLYVGGGTSSNWCNVSKLIPVFGCCGEKFENELALNKIKILNFIT